LRRIAARTVCRALAIAGALSACGSPPPQPSADNETKAHSSFTEIAPPGCAIGLSGPTLNPGDALRNARRQALTELAGGNANTIVQIDSELLVSGGAQRGGEFTRQDISGAVRDARIVAIWAEGAPSRHNGTHERHVYALACDRGAPASRLADPTVPCWILNVPSDDTRVCALGIGGPTRNPLDQPAATLRDARNALAAALESKLEAVIIDTGRRKPLIAAELQSSERARQRAESVDEFEATWEDVDGQGPLGLKLVQYGLVCVPI